MFEKLPGVLKTTSMFEMFLLKMKQELEVSECDLTITKSAWEALKI
jgi:hypothetical protein